MSIRMQQRRGTAEQWTTSNPTLAAGELGFETDTNKFKIGNGVDSWTAISYAGADDLSNYVTQSQLQDYATTAALADYATTNSPTLTGLTDFQGIADFSDAVVVGIDALPDQTGNDGKYLTTDGNTSSWQTVASPVPHPFTMIG